MRNKSSRRLPLRDLFAERRVHVRSGVESRYVVLSPALQIGVALGGVALVALLGLASYKAISGQLELVTQQRSLTELAADKAEAETKATRLAALQQDSEAAEREIARLTAALAAAENDGETRDTAAALQAQLAESTAKNQELAAALEQASAARESEAAARSSELEDLRAEVTGLRAEIDRLEREAQSLRRTATQPPAGRPAVPGLNAPRPPTRPASGSDCCDGSSVGSPRSSASQYTLRGGHAGTHGIPLAAASYSYAFSACPRHTPSASAADHKRSLLHRSGCAGDYQPRTASVVARQP